MILIALINFPPSGRPFAGPFAANCNPLLGHRHARFNYMRYFRFYARLIVPEILWHIRPAMIVTVLISTRINFSAQLYQKHNLHVQFGRTAEVTRA